MKEEDFESLKIFSDVYQFIHSDEKRMLLMGYTNHHVSILFDMFISRHLDLHKIDKRMKTGLSKVTLYPDTPQEKVIFFSNVGTGVNRIRGIKVDRVTYPEDIPREIRWILETRRYPVPDEDSIMNAVGMIGRVIIREYNIIRAKIRYSEGLSPCWDYLIILKNSLKKKIRIR